MIFFGIALVNAPYQNIECTILPYRLSFTVNACLMPRHQNPRLHIRRDRQRPYFQCKNESNFGRLRPKSISRKRRAALARKPTKRTPFF
jgi:hypothetical protein